MILKKIVQIWIGDISDEHEECMGQVKLFAENLGIGYERINGSSEKSVKEHMIASDNLRLEIMKTNKRTLYVDSDIKLHSLPEFNVNIPAFPLGRGRYPVEALIYSGDTRWFQDLQVPAFKIGGLKKIMSLKYLRVNNIVDTIGSEHFTHLELNKHLR